MPHARGTRIALAAGALIATGALVAAVLLWPDQHTIESAHTPDITRLPLVIKDLPKGFTVTAGEKVLGAEDIAALKAPADGVVKPAACAATPADRADNVLGAKLNIVNANRDGVFYMVTAQEARETSAPHTDPAIDCSYNTIERANGYTITTPAVAPVEAGLKIEALHIVTKADSTIQDSYLFRTWIDPRRVVSVVVRSDPTHQPPANPIDPTLAKHLLERAITVVRGAD
jgi:hypothetical protein